jgi:CubicO group peptidase (beta-lactamase class C family)
MTTAERIQASGDRLGRIAPDLQRRLADLVAKNRLPGASAGIVLGDQLAWEGAVGFADFASGRRPDSDTLYRVASISKTFTATAIVQLRDRGLLKLDDALVRFLPEFAAVTCRHGTVEDVTLRRLLSHRSGLISEGPFDYWDSMRFPTMAEILAHLPETEVVLPPDRGAKYSNLAYALLGEVIARLSGEPYEQYMERWIFAPLGMSASTFVPELAERGPLATGYAPHPFEDRPEPSGHTPSNGIAAAAGLYTSVRDLARWLSFELRAGPPTVGFDAAPLEPLDRQPPDPDAGIVLDPRSLDEMHTPQTMDLTWTAARCLGWFGQRRGENVYVGHGGSQHGFITSIQFCRAQRCGAIVLTNEGRHGVAGQAANELLDLVVEELKKGETPAFAAPPSATPPELKRFLGRYALKTWGTIQIEYRDGFLRTAPLPPEIAALHAPSRLLPTEDPLVYRVAQERGAGELARFTEAEDGSISGFRLSEFSYRKLD